MTDLETILSWFQTGDMPTQEEFQETFSSFRHNNTKIPVAEVEDLQGELNKKVSSPLENGKFYIKRESGVTSTEVLTDETLASVISKGNYCPKPIYFVDGDEEYTSLGMNPITYSFFWGDMKRDHTGLTNIAMGYYSMSSLTVGESNSAYSIGALYKLTSGYKNTAFGQATLYNLTTGYSNSAFGQGGLYNLTTGFKNVSLGTSAGAAVTSGSLNTLLGYKANNSVNFGDKNIFIGANSAQGVTGSNNIMIGVGAGVNGGALNNKLIIHSNHTLSGYSNTSEGNFTTPQLSYLDNALITGDFAEKWVRLNSSLQVSGLPNAQNDSTFTRKLVQKSTGEIGYVEEGVKESGQINSDDFIIGGSSANGRINYEHQEGSDFVTIRFRLNATLKDDNIYIPLPFGVGISSFRRFANLGFNDQFINISSQEQVIILSKLNFDGDLSVYINECIVFPYGYEGAQD